MKGMTWFLGVFVILLGFECRSSNAWQWTVVWLSAAVLWFLIGCGVLLFSLAKTAFDKTRAGATEALKRGLASPLAPKKEG